MRKPYTMISCDRTMHVPEHVATCPICHAPLYLSFDQWDLQEDGTWAASESGIRLDCTTEPEVDPKTMKGEEELEDWIDDHYHMPYVDWRPVQHTVWQWIYARYRFDVAEDEVRRVEQWKRLGLKLPGVE